MFKKKWKGNTRKAKSTKKLVVYKLRKRTDKVKPSITLPLGAEMAKPNQALFDSYTCYFTWPVLPSD